LVRIPNTALPQLSRWADDRDRQTVLSGDSLCWRQRPRRLLGRLGAIPLCFRAALPWSRVGRLSLVAGRASFLWRDGPCRGGALTSSRGPRGSPLSLMAQAGEWAIPCRPSRETLHIVPGGSGGISAAVSGEHHREPAPRSRPRGSQPRCPVWSASWRSGSSSARHRSRAAR
jgi:hypothetical protein